MRATSRSQMLALRTPRLRVLEVWLSRVAERSSNHKPLRLKSSARELVLPP